MPLWVLVPCVVLAFLLGLLVPTRSEPKLSSGAGPAPATPSAAVPSTESSAPLEPSLEERARGGDIPSLVRLERTPLTARTPAHSLALAQGKVAARLNGLRELARRLQGRRELIRDPAIQQELLRYSRDPATALGTLEVLVAQRHPVALDLLFQIWTGVPDRTPTTELAEELLSSRELRATASPALAVVMDLREIERCDEALEVLERATQVADTRALRPLMRLNNKRGCGPKKTGDCFRCLRQREGRRALVAAADAATRRPAPQF